MDDLTVFIYFATLGAVLALIIDDIKNRLTGDEDEF